MNDEWINKYTEKLYNNISSEEVDPCEYTSAHKIFSKIVKAYNTENALECLKELLILHPNDSHLREMILNIFNNYHINDIFPYGEKEIIEACLKSTSEYTIELFLSDIDKWMNENFPPNEFISMVEELKIRPSAKWLEDEKRDVLKRLNEKISKGY